MSRLPTIFSGLAMLVCSTALAQSYPMMGQPMLVQQQTISQPSNMMPPPTLPAAGTIAAPALAAPPVVQVVMPPPTAPVVSTSFTQSPAYIECTQLANTNPIAAEQKAAEWLKIDDGVAPHHCRAMALFGQMRFVEAAEALAMVRGKIAPANVTLRTYVTRQGAKAWMEAKRPDAAIDTLTVQINEMAGNKGDNATESRLSAELLLDRAKLRVTYGQLAQAVQDLDHAVSLNPANEDVLLERAQAFSQLGDLALAKQDVALVLRLNPGNSRAQQLQRQLNEPASATAQGALQPLQ